MDFDRRRDPAFPAWIRRAALGGVVGPTAFIGGWITSAAITDRSYSSIDEAISRLAAVGADTRVLMTAGFIGFGVALPVYGVALRRAVPGPAWAMATLAGVTTLGVAATPLDRSPTVDTLHALLAGIGYVALAATPLLAARPLLRGGHITLARFGLAVGSVSAVSLALASTSLPTGLFQRLGLTGTDAWIVASAITIARGRLSCR